MARYLRLPHSASVGLGPTLERYAALPPLPPYDTNPAPALPVPLSKNTPAATTDGPAWAVGPNGQAVGFSFGGLQAAAQRLTDKLVAEHHVEDASTTSTSAEQRDVPEAVQREVSRLFQTAAVAHLCQQTRKVIDRLQTEEGLDPARLGGVVASGGVASNQYLRKESVQTKETDGYGLMIQARGDAGHRKGRRSCRPGFLPANRAVHRWVTVYIQQGRPGSSQTTRR